jgi:hypothetical protein
MESERIIWLFLGGYFVLCAMGLGFVKTDKEALKQSVHINPGMALFRFGTYRWDIVVVLSVIGISLLSAGLGWIL